ncbi:hypothetical protein MIC97_05635 [Aquamicrobium sp. NLF2-7]|uniref:hypothetical protein n=1 Tax=Aquamicrobium sp. NLF2-7 TaxID=2918753 RepID=UPI001EFB4375|nr:hypothetical protein [Aquamicrobium sp. NLF2-7]MCG8270989.1 hypothetical protein [Aquamicrobium sp. NLF2-7]
MADIAHLGLSVEYQDADKAALALTRMSAAAKKAEDAAAGVVGASSKAAKAAATITAGTSKARIEWETYDEVVARTGSKIKDAARSADDAAKSVKGHGEAANDTAKGIENASLAAQGFSVALGKVKEVIAGFVLNAVTVAVGVLIAELAKLVDWAQWAKAGLYTLADAIEAVAPYAAMAAAGLALIYAPAILAGLQAVTLGILSAAKAVGTLAIALVAANPGAAFVLGITAAVGAANIFRDELAQIFGRDIVKDVKDGVNTIIGAMVGAYDAVVAVWKALPGEFGRLGKMAANALLDGLGSLTIDWKNPFTGNVTRLVDFDFSDLKQKVDEVEAGAEKVAQAAYQDGKGPETDVRVDLRKARILTIIATYLRGRASGAQRERDRQAAKERDSYAKHIEDIELAATAGRAVRPDDGGMQSDPNNRDNAR